MEYKKLSTLQKGDILYSEGDIREYKILAIKHDHAGEFCKTDALIEGGYGRWQQISEFSNLKSSARVTVTSGYLVTETYYTTKREALENKKADLMHQLDLLRAEAIKRFDLVKKFREQYWEELNITLVDSELSKLNCL